MPTQSTQSTQTLGDQVFKLGINPPDEIPKIVRLLENPESKLSLPGRITLYNHDCIHVLLNEQTTPNGEAFVIGFTMGNDEDTKPYHAWIFHFFARYIYPEPFRMKGWQQRVYFAAGLKYGRKIKPNNINTIDFYGLRYLSVAELRNQIGINLYELSLIKQKIKQSIQKKQCKIEKRCLHLKIFSCFCASLGGILLAANIKISYLGFVPLALSSSSMLFASVLEKNKFSAFYSGSLLFTVDLLGIYRWIIV